MTTKTPTLTLDYVKSTMDSLLETNLTTSTLEIKLEMRKNGVWCNQDDVKPLVDEVYELNANSYKRNLVNNHYYEYSKVSIQGNVGSSSPLGAKLYIKGVGNNTSKNLLSIETPKMSFKSNELKALSQYPNKNEWIVFDAHLSVDKYSIFDENLTRDKVRSRFATLNKIKIQDVRAKRISNIS